MGFFKKLFSERTMNVIVGTCFCILIILSTLFAIELGFFGEDGIDRSRLGRWVDRIESRDDFDSYPRKNIVISTDTVNGNLFQFKEMLVIPLVEVKSDSSGVKRTILNFKVYNTKRKTESTLFPTCQAIVNSKLIQVKEHLIWFIEADGQFFIYDEQGTGLIATSFPIGYSFVYPETSEVEIREKLDSGEMMMPIVPQDFKMPDAYIANRAVVPFSIVGNHLLLCAQKDKDKNKKYWTYDLETKVVRGL